MARQLAPGDVIGGFRLEQKFHHGGMGTLWKVSRADIAAPLVMKLPFLLPGEDPLTIVSYETEQMIMPRLSGSHVPAFIAAGDFDGPYVVMELIAGRSLLDRLPELPLPVGEVADLGARIADALEDIHRQRVIHLDLKPSNIMIRDGGSGGAGSGEVVLLDFGLSRHLDLPDLPGEELEGPIGTGVYIAPEQLLDVRNDRRSDLFALGVLLYFFATGTRPFGEPRTIGQWRKRLTRAPLPPRRLRPDCRHGSRKSSCIASKSIRASATRARRILPSICAIPSWCDSPREPNVPRPAACLPRYRAGCGRPMPASPLRRSRSRSVRRHRSSSPPSISARKTRR